MEEGANTHGAKAARLDDEGVGEEGGIARAQRGLRAVLEEGRLVGGRLRGSRRQRALR